MCFPPSSRVFKGIGRFQLLPSLPRLRPYPERTARPSPCFSNFRESPRVGGAGMTTCILAEHCSAHEHKDPLHLGMMRNCHVDRTRSCARTFTNSRDGKYFNEQIKPDASGWSSWARNFARLACPDAVTGFFFCAVVSRPARASALKCVGRHASFLHWRDSLITEG